MYIIELLEDKDVEREGVEGEVLEDPGNEGTLGENEMPHISLQAFNGMNTYRTMRVTRWAKNTPLHILIDSGSTHNFLDIAVAKKLHCDVRKIPAL